MAKIKGEILKRAVIAGAAAAMKFRLQYPRDTEREVIKKVIENTKNIIKELDKY